VQGSVDGGRELLEGPVLLAADPTQSVPQVGHAERVLGVELDHLPPVARVAHGEVALKRRALVSLGARHDRPHLGVLRELQAVSVRDGRVQHVVALVHVQRTPDALERRVADQLARVEQAHQFGQRPCRSDAVRRADLQRVVGRIVEHQRVLKRQSLDARSRKQQKMAHVIVRRQKFRIIHHSQEQRLGRSAEHLDPAVHDVNVHHAIQILKLGSTNNP